MIEPEPDGECELCGMVAELRPYGPNGEHICHPCGMKDEAAANARFLDRVNGREPAPRRDKR